MKSNKIFIISHDSNIPTGGVKQIYRMVDVLNNNGFEAFVLHNKKGFRCNWFKNDTKVIHDYIFHKEFKLIDLVKNNKNKFKIAKHKLLLKLLHLFYKSIINPEDIIVFPEVYGTNIHLVKPKNKIVIFNQNCYYTFHNFGLNNFSELPYKSKNFIGTIVGSEDAKKYIDFTFPDKQVFRIRLGIDFTLFHPNSNKKKQIAFMPRKLYDDVEQVINILKIRNKLNDWSLVSIENRNENEVAQTMQESMIFLSFNHREGFGLPPIEAMACGCVVIGYKGRAGEEYFNEIYNYSVEEGNIIGFVNMIETILSENSFESLIKKGNEASNFVLENYNNTNEKIDILNAWNKLLKLNS